MGSLIPLFWTSGDVYLWFQSKGRFHNLYVSLLACKRVPQIPLWCNTSWPLGSQYGGWAVFDPLTHMQPLVGLESGMLHSVWQGRRLTEWDMPVGRMRIFRFFITKVFSCLHCVYLIGNQSNCLWQRNPADSYVYVSENCFIKQPFSHQYLSIEQVVIRNYNSTMTHKMR